MIYKLRILPREFIDTNVLDYYQTVTDIATVDADSKNEAIIKYLKQFKSVEPPIIYEVL